MKIDDSAYSTFLNRRTSKIAYRYAKKLLILHISYPLRDKKSRVPRYATKNRCVPHYAKNFLSVPLKLGVLIFYIFQKIVLRDFA